MTAKTFTCRTPYPVHPRFDSRLHGVWRRLGLEARHTGWNGGGRDYTLTGTRKAMVRFWKGVGLSPSQVWEMLEPTQD